MNVAQAIREALDRFLAEHPVLPQHGTLLVDIRDGAAHRVELKTSVFVRDLTTGAGVRHTQAK